MKITHFDNTIPYRLFRVEYGGIEYLMLVNKYMVYLYNADNKMIFTKTFANAMNTFNTNNDMLDTLNIVQMVDRVFIQIEMKNIFSRETTTFVVYPTAWADGKPTFTLELVERSE